MRFVYAGMLCLTAYLPHFSFGQSPRDTSNASVASIPEKISGKYIQSVSSKADKASRDVDKQTEKYLAKLQKQEAKMQKKVSKIDSVAASNIFASSAQEYQHLRDNINNKAQSILRGSGQYIPWLDTASTSLKYLENSGTLGKISANATQAKAAIAKVKALEDEFKKAGNVREFIRQRKERLKYELANYNFGSELKNYNQTAFFYAQQVNEYKAALDDPDKMAKKALSLLEKLPAFQDFLSKNSMLAGLFNAPGSSGGTGSVAGLQTNSQVQAILSQQMGIMGPNGQQIAQQNVSAAQGQLTQLRNRLNQSGSSGGDMPEGLKPNSQKTKTWLKRIEYGVNIQSTRSSYYFPASTDLGLTAGFKINDKSTVGIGASYNMAWGKDIRHIALSTLGAGLRSYLDIQMKKGIYASGGYEYNLVPVVVPQGSTGTYWQKSGLLGISKAVKVKSQYFKQAKLQLLWDFLSYQQVPRTQPFIFRIGYNF